MRTISCCRCARVLARLRARRAVPGSDRAPTPADAKTFLDTVNDTMYRLGVAQGQAGWVQQTYITDDTEALAARTNQEAIDAVARFAKDATSTTRSRCRPTSGVSSTC